MRKKILTFLIVMMVAVLGAQIRWPILSDREVQMESSQKNIEIYGSGDGKTEIKTGAPEEEDTGERNAGGEYRQSERRMVIVAETEAVKERDVNTGDFTPIFGMFFLAVCSLLLGIEEVLRRIKY